MSVHRIIEKKIAEQVYREESLHRRDRPLLFIEQVKKALTALGLKILQGADGCPGVSSLAGCPCRAPESFEVAQSMVLTEQNAAVSSDISREVIACRICPFSEQSEKDARCLTLYRSKRGNIASRFFLAGRRILARLRP